IGRNDQTTQYLRQLLRGATAQVLEHKAKTTTRTKTDNRWWRERNGSPALHVRERLPEPGDDRVSAFAIRSSIGKVLERQAKTARIWLRVIVYEVETDNRARIRDGRLLFDDCFDLLHDIQCAPN